MRGEFLLWPAHTETSSKGRRFAAEDSRRKKKKCSAQTSKEGTFPSLCGPTACRQRGRAGRLPRASSTRRRTPRRPRVSKEAHVVPTVPAAARAQRQKQYPACAPPPPARRITGTTKRTLVETAKVKEYHHRRTGRGKGGGEGATRGTKRTWCAHVRLDAGTFAPFSEQRERIWRAGTKASELAHAWTAHCLCRARHSDKARRRREKDKDETNQAVFSLEGSAVRKRAKERQRGAEANVCVCVCMCVCVCRQRPRHTQGDKGASRVCLP